MMSLCHCSTSQQAQEESSPLTIDSVLAPPTLQWLVNHQEIASGSIVGGVITLGVRWTSNEPAKYLEITSSLPALHPYAVHADGAATAEIIIPTKSLFGEQIVSMPFDARLIDQQGNVVHHPLLLIANNQGPQFVTTTVNGGNTILQHATINVAASVDSALPLQELSVTAALFEGQIALNNNATEPLQFQATLNTANYIDQSAQLYFHAVDTAGNQTTSSMSLAINNLIFDTVRHFNNADGTIAPTQAFDFASNYLFISDLNHDGVVDIHFSRQEPGLFPGNIFTLFNPLSNDYSVSSNWWNYLPGSSHWAPIGSWGHHRGLVGCDLNHDNNQDAVWIANQPGGDLIAQASIAYGPQSTSGQFAGYQLLNMSDGVPGILTCTDLNNDQEAEILYRERIYYAPFSNGHFRNMGNAATTNIVGSVGDVDNDGFNDAAIIDNNSASFKIAYGPINKNGSLSYSPLLPRNPFPNGTSALIQGVGDLNQDGYDDIILPDYSGSQPHNGNDAMKIYWGQASRSQPLQSTVILHPDAAQGVQFFAQIDRGIEAADFSGDGKIDLATFAQHTSSGAQEVTILLGPGFTTARHLYAPTYLHPNAKFGFALAAHDFDLNERSELVVVVPGAYASGEGELLIYQDQIP